MLADFEVADASLSRKIARILSRSFRMSALIFFAAYFQLSIERARSRGNNIAAQDTEPLFRLYQFFVGKCSDKLAVSGLVEFT
jgi:hypothetical protein